MKLAKNCLGRMEADEPHTWMCKGDLFVLEGSVEEALHEYANSQEAFILKFGRDHFDMAALLERQVGCYILLGDKKRAEKCMGKMERYGGAGRLLKMEVKRMKHKPEKKISRPKARGKCSNPMCVKEEKTPGEFLMCSRCKRATYCSALCQKKHWKAGHNKHCKK